MAGPRRTGRRGGCAGLDEEHRHDPRLACGTSGFCAGGTEPQERRACRLGRAGHRAGDAGPAGAGGALLVFTAVSGIGIAMPYLMWITMGEAAIAPLDRLKVVMARNDTLIVTAILAVLGLVVVVNALAYL